LGLGSATALCYGGVSVAIGSNIEARANYSICIGRFLKTVDGYNQAIVIGSGLSGNPLVNDQSNSLYLGFGSNLPTLVVTPASGANLTGNVGIGTTSPSSLFSVGTTSQFQINSSGAIAAATGIISSGTIYFSGNVGIKNSNPSKELDVTGAARITGNVGIGVAPDAGTTYRLQVCGSIRTKEVVVEDNSWCDFVFEDSYKRMNVDEKEQYLKSKKHLPFIASAKEINENGLPLKETLTGLTQNVEEMNLDMIDLYKMIQKLRKENVSLKAEVDKLQKK
jgi:hypothetical protein